MPDARALARMTLPETGLAKLGTLTTREHPQESDEVVVAWEEAIVVKIEIKAVGGIAACAASEHREEVDHVLVGWIEAIVVEVDWVALWAGEFENT